MSKIEQTLSIIKPDAVERNLDSQIKVVMILEKENAIMANRELMGSTNPNDAKEGTIRKKFGISIDKNSVHGSDSPENAKKEINFFFKI